MYIKDYTEEITHIQSDEVRYSTKFILYSSGTTKKLHLVKAIKEVTGMWLKAAKDFMDESSHHPVMFIKKMTESELKSFRQMLSNCDEAEFYLDDIERSRNRKLIQLGLCDDADIADDLSDLFVNEIFVGGHSIDRVRSVLQNILLEFNQDKLKEIYNNYENYLR